MLGSAVPSSASVYTATTSATPSSPTRPSRLRGLSYLRSVTHNHLHGHLNRGSESPTPAAAAPPLTRSTSSPGSPIIVAPERGRQQSDSPTTVPPSTIQSAENGWIPTIQGRSGLARESLHPTETSTESAAPEPSSTTDTMTRSRTIVPGFPGPTPTPAFAQSNQGIRRHTPGDMAAATAGPLNQPEAATPTPADKSKDMPTIRFIPHVEARSPRPSLTFSALSRTLKTQDAIVKVGRYSERDHSTGDAVGFKSKVVSRRHCEFWCRDGQWYIRDVKSSSGTFLNHVRLSSPGAESRPYPVNDGDVVQLGIDFKGGEEPIFRCVKIRVECNRGWQKSLNTFNTSAHKQLLKSAQKAKTKDSDAQSVNSSECSICLNPVAPCQALFVAPCSHVWHYKCIRNLIHGPNWPNFLCPNCRFVADLDADVEAPAEDEFEKFTEDEVQESTGNSDERESESPGPSMSDDEEDPSRSGEPVAFPDADDVDADALARILQESTLSSPSNQAEAGAARRNARPDSGALPPPPLSRADRSDSDALPPSQPIAIHQPKVGSRSTSNDHGARSTTPTSHTQFALSAGGPIADGPMTPRNDAGPFVLDGSAGRDRVASGIDSSLAGEPVEEVSEPASLEERPS